MDFQQQQQQQQQLLLAAALWPPQRAAALASMLRNADNAAANNHNANANANNAHHHHNHHQALINTSSNNNGAGLAAESAILAQLQHHHQHHQTPPPPRQIIQAPIANAATIRLFDPVQALPLSASSVPEALINQQQQQQNHHLDQLVVAAAFQQMVERLRGVGAETTKFVPSQTLLGDNNNTAAAGGHHHQQLPSSTNFGSSLSNLSSASSAASSASVPPPSAAVQQIKPTESAGTKKSPPSDNAEENSDNNAPQTTFVPMPTTTADELVGHALARIVEQLDTDGAEAADDGGGGHFQEGPSSSADGTPPISRIANNEEVLLCKVCSDKASGFHYGIFSCEGCKGFFRRSLQNKIDYRPCTQSQKCQIVRASRNRCQECRWRKCIEAGMSKDSVRYGRVPKREKEKLREEMRRDSARSAMEQLSAELEDEKALVDQLERAFAELGAEMRGGLDCFESAECADAASDAAAPAGGGHLLDARRYLQMTQWVCRFASRIRGFRLLRREERVRLIRDAHFPVLLLRLCTLRGGVAHLSSSTGDKVSTLAAMDKMSTNSNNHLLVGLASVPKCLMVSSSASRNGQFVERIVEFVHRIREARPPVELCPTDRQLSLIAALCLCRPEGAGEHAAGALMSASAGGDDTAGGHMPLQLAIARRIHERLWQSLNATLATDLLQFGPSLLRRDSMERQHLAAMLEALRQLRLAHRQCLAVTNCCNVPAELFTSTAAALTSRRATTAINGTGSNGGGGGGTTATTPRAPPPARDESAGGGGGVSTKRRKLRDDAQPQKEDCHQQQQYTVAGDGDSAVGGGTVTAATAVTTSTNIVYGTASTTTAQPQQPTAHRQQLVDDLPTLRRELERPPAIVVMSNNNNNNAVARAGTPAATASASSCAGNAAAGATVCCSSPTVAAAATVSSCSSSASSSSSSSSAAAALPPYSPATASLSSLRELLARPPILHVVVQQQQQHPRLAPADEQPLNLCLRDHNSSDYHHRPLN